MTCVRKGPFVLSSSEEALFEWMHARSGNLTV